MQLIGHWINVHLETALKVLIHIFPMKKNSRSIDSILNLPKLVLYVIETLGNVIDVLVVDILVRLHCSLFRIEISMLGLVRETVD